MIYFSLSRGFENKAKKWYHASMEQRNIPRIRLAIHEIKNAGGDGSAKSLLIGIGALIGICGAAAGGLMLLARYTPILDVLGLR